MPKTPTFLHYALLAGVAFLASLALIGLLLWRAEVLVRWGLEGRLFYLAMIPLGLAVAAFLFGCLKSYAVYKGKALGRDGTAMNADELKRWLQDLLADGLVTFVGSGPSCAEGLPGMGAFLCIGYGFNDDYLQTDLTRA